MIFGIGTDIVEVARIEAAILQFGNDFAKRILAPSEQHRYLVLRDKDTHIKARFLAKRFAAKEAFAKALGTGLRAPATFHNIAISHDVLGKPLFVLAKELQAFIETKHIVRLHLSVSDEKNLATAFVTLETY